MRRKYTNSVFFPKIEPCGFACHEVTYLVAGTITPGRRGTREDPPEDPEVDVIDVYRIDPFDNTSRPLKPSEWPFTFDETMEIQYRLAYEKT